MSWDFQPTLPAAAQLLTNDGLAVGAGVTVSPGALNGSASGVSYNTYSRSHISENVSRAASKFTAAARLVLLLGVQLAIATGSGVTDTASAPSGSATGAAAATGAGVTVTASAPTGFATGGGQGSAIGAGATVTTSAPAGSAAGAGAATGAGGSVSTSAPAGLAAGQTSPISLRYQFSSSEVQRVIPAPVRAVQRLLIITFGGSSAFGAGVTATAVAPTGSANGGGTPGAAVGSGVTALAFPPAGTAAPPNRFLLTNRSASIDVTWVNKRSPVFQILISSQAVGSASGAVDTATASAPQGSATGNSTVWIFKQAKYFEAPEIAFTTRNLARHFALLNSFGPDFPVVLQSSWDDNLQAAPFFSGRPYPWTLIILGQIIASASGPGVTVTTSAPTAFATGDNAGLATGAGATVTASAPVATAKGNTTTIAAGVTVTASQPTGSAVGPANITASGVVVAAQAPTAIATGGGGGVAIGVIDTVTAVPPQGSAAVVAVAAGAGVTVQAFEVNASATGDALAVGGIGTAVAFAPNISGPVTIGAVRITITQNRTKVTIT